MSASTIGAAVLGVSVLIFILQNTQQVRISWLFLDGEYALWFVIVLTSVLSVGAERMAVYAWRRGRRTEARKHKA